MMKKITFIDTEIDPNNKQILDIGAIKSDGNFFHKSSFTDFLHFMHDSEYICGHNIFKHDLKYIGKALVDIGIKPAHMIDTLHLSPLLFPTKPYHALLKEIGRASCRERV